MTTAPRDDDAAAMAGRDPGDSRLTGRYVSVVIVWVCVLLALYAFSAYFG